MSPLSLEPDAIKERLQSLELFKEMDEFETLEYEVDLLCRAQTIPEGMPRRESYVRLESVPENCVVLSQGDLTTRLYVVLEGAMSAYRADPDEGSDLFASFSAGDWFGESSAFSNQPALFSVRSEEPCQVLTIDARLFRKLFLEDDTFHERIDEKYRERSLLLHLKAAPVFSALSKKELLAVREQVELLRFEEEKGGETIAEEGDDADAFYLVRGGAVRCFTRDDEGRERVLSYYMGNSSFGEHAIATTESKWPGTYETMAATDVVKIPRKVFEEARETDPRMHRIVTNTANLILGGGPDQIERLYRKKLSADEIDVMVYRQSVKGGNSLVIDKAKCIRCNACVEACASVHDDRVPRISKIGTKVATDDVLITACYHCNIPECMASCNYGAIRRDVAGTVVFVYDNCVGCAACVESCPYDVIRMTDPRVNELSVERSRSRGILGRLLALFRGGERLPVPPEGASMGQVMNFGEEEVDVMGKAIKCDRCAGLPFEACVYNCPTFAITRRKPEELFTA